jgi:uncharacterized membrane protein YgcG
MAVVGEGRAIEERQAPEPITLDAASLLQTPEPELDPDVGSPAAPTGARRWRWVVAGAVIVVVVGAVAIAATAGGGGGSSTSSAAPTKTATVGRGDLVKTESVSGTLAFAATHPIVNQRQGTLTSVPAAGSTVDRGGAVYRVDDQPVILMLGATPAYRDLSTASPPGPDIAELKQNLDALGFAASLADDNVFDAATQAAVVGFENTVGLDGDGVVQLGEVAFVPGPIRISGSRVDVGGTVSSGATVIDATATTKAVTASLSTTQANLAPVGTVVTVQLPDGKSATAKVTSVSVAAASASGSGSGSNGGSGGSGAGGSGGQSSATATIAFDDPAVANNYDSASVDVILTDAKRTGVLKVPVTALVALAEGGYAVQVVDASAQGSHLVGVTPGLYTSTDVEVTDTNLQPGDKVVVPASGT